MADARELVGVLPLFEMRLSLADGPLPRSQDGELTMRCRDGGNARDEARDVFPASPHPRCPHCRSPLTALFAGATCLKIRVYRCLRCRTEFTAPYASANPPDTNDHP
jgi:hypothetical protein